MDVNPFLKWVEKELYPCKYYYVPETPLVPKILEKLGIDQVEKTQYERQKETIIYFLVRHWGNLANKEEFLLPEGQVIKVVSRKHLPFTEIRFVNGWLGSPTANLFLKRVFTGGKENDNNPANVTATDLQNFLPDVTYLPKLLEELEISSFENLDWEAGYYRTAWSEINPSKWSTLYVGGKDFGANILWIKFDGKKSTYYLDKLPTKVIEALRNSILYGKEKIPRERWTKDAFQAIADRGLSGKDLISMCISDTKFNEMCNSDNQKLFRIRLMKEFGMDWNKNNHGYKTPRELYTQMHEYHDIIFIGVDADDIRLVPSTRIDSFRVLETTSRDKYLMIPSTELSSIDVGVYVIFFPGAKELSFYGTVDEDDVSEVYQTENIEKFIDRQQVLDLFEKIIDNLYASNDENEIADEDVAWLANLTEDTRILSFRSEVNEE